MAEDLEKIRASYPLPVYNYRVTVLNDGDATVLSFATVSGLAMEYEAVTYRHGMSFLTGVRSIPGMAQPVEITLTRGVAPSADFLASWLASSNRGGFTSVDRRDIVIDLCDQKGEAVVRWTVTGALPVKIDAPSFDAAANEVAIESLALLAHNLHIDYNP